MWKHRTRRPNGRRLSLFGPGYSNAGNFSPLWLPGLALWLDASDPTTLYQDSALTTLAAADADPVGGWKDKSGNARHALQATSSQRPALKLAQYGVYSAIQFDGVDDILSVTTTLAQPAWEFVAASLLTVTVSNQTIFDGGGQNENRLLYKNNNVAAYAGAQITDSFSPSTGVMYIAACRFNGASSSLQVNNRTAVTGNAGTTGVTGLRTGGDGTAFGNVLVFERIRYQRDLVASEVLSLRNYMNAKYGGW